MRRVHRIELLVGLSAVVRMGEAAKINDAVKHLSGEAARPLADYANDNAEALSPEQTL